MRHAPVAALGLGGLLLAACAGGGGSGGAEMAQRPEVAVQDEVGAIDRAQLVGRWSCRELNPYPGRPAAMQTIAFNPDGTGHNSALVDMAQGGMPLPGKMAVDFTYDWRVEGERVQASNVQTSVKAADGSPMTGFFAGLSQAVINNFSSQAKPGAMDVLKLGRSDLVLRSTDATGSPVLDCTRV